MKENIMSNKILITGAIAAAITIAGVTSFDVEAKGKKIEKCYGIAKAAQNDCKAGPGTSCAGTSTKDGQKDAWMYAAKGSCTKIVGGSLTIEK